MENDGGCAKALKELPGVLSEEVKSVKRQVVVLKIIKDGSKKVYFNS